MSEEVEEDAGGPSVLPFQCQKEDISYIPRLPQSSSNAIGTAHGFRPWNTTT